MKLINQTQFPDTHLRKIISWCRTEIGLPARDLRTAKVSYTRKGKLFRGFGTPTGIRVAIARHDLGYPYEDSRKGSEHVLADRLEAFVSLIAHEIEHVRQFKAGVFRQLRENRTLEPRTRAAASRVLETFRARRPVLEVEWTMQTPPVANERTDRHAHND